jgi:mitochondrial cardiolipin hydrolase
MATRIKFGVCNFRTPFHSALSRRCFFFYLVALFYVFAMNPIDQLAQEFQKTLSDKLLTKAERQALAVSIAEAGLDQRKRDILRAKVFDMAKGGLGAESYFTLEWLESASRLLEPKADDGSAPGAARSVGSHVFFSPGDDCLNAICSGIRAAIKQIDVCVFTISDDRISEALIERHKRGVKLRILTDNEKLFDAGSDIERFHRAGIEVRVDQTEYHMHHKFALIDGKVAITGSYNWTRSAAAYNEENLLVTDDQGILQRYAQEFERLWIKMTPFK